MFLFFDRGSALTPLRIAHATRILRVLGSTHSLTGLSHSKRLLPTMTKRKRSTGVDLGIPPKTTMPIVPLEMLPPPMPISRRSSGRKTSRSSSMNVDVNPETNSQVMDGSQALRASPDAEGPDEKFNVAAAAPGKKSKKGPATPKVKPPPSDSSLSDLSDIETPATSVPESDAPKPTTKKNAPKETTADPEADDADEPADEEEIKAALSRPPPVDSDYIPLPWKGRLGYACLNTYLRTATPAVFSSRTCRIASIIEHRHPLADPTQPEHSTKNRPDKSKPANMRLGEHFVESLGLANARDIPKMLRWNDKYGIKFMRLSSEMFPFASHEDYGYKLAPFASEALAEAGRVAAELGHRLTTHPGQFTQLGSPRKVVIDNAIRDLEYHAELLSLLRLPDQVNKDAVMILHMGGTFGDKAATLDRFREHYPKLNQDIKNRLVLENDDMSWSVHDLLPICEELNIPLVLDYHHHNIIFDSTQIREGTHDIMNLYDRITATWKRKGITQKMHYSEPTPQAITGQQRRKHSPRVKTLPPCASDMDLMIEAKDKEQAVFELMRIFKLPGWSTFNDITPYTRQDENKPWKPPPKKKTPRKKKNADPDEEPIIEEPEPQPPPIVPDEELNMGGPERRVYWPPGMEEWLRPKKREIKKKKDTEPTPKKKTVTPKKQPVVKEEDEEDLESVATTMKNSAKAPGPKKRKTMATPKKNNTVHTPSTSEDDDDADLELDSSADDEPLPAKNPKRTSATASKVIPPAPPSRRQSGRGARKVVASYAEEDEDVDME